MTFNLIRGLKRGAAAAAATVVVLPINNLVRHEPVVGASVLAGAVIAFILMGLAGGFTDKIGFEAGDA